MLLSCVYEGVKTCSTWQGAFTRSTPLRIQKSLWFPPLATPCLFILHPILASVLIAVRILSFSLNYRFLPKCHICGPGHSPAPIPNRTAAPLHQSWGGHTCPSWAYVTSKERVTCKCSQYWGQKSLKLAHVNLYLTNVIIKRKKKAHT